MAKKNASNDKIVTRISASDTPSEKGTKAKDSSKPKKVAKKSTKKVAISPTDVNTKKGILGSILGYFTGSWYELRQVRWPNRRATWSLTGAVLLFSGFFVVFIVLLDIIFKYVFDLILK